MFPFALLICIVMKHVKEICVLSNIIVICRSDQLAIVETLLHILQMISTVEKGVQGLGE